MHSSHQWTTHNSQVLPSSRLSHWAEFRGAEFRTLSLPQSNLSEPGSASVPRKTRGSKHSLFQGCEVKTLLGTNTTLLYLHSQQRD
ncbi:unnamed protein product, partial [Coccothraustes coccothraustes]